MRDSDKKYTEAELRDRAEKFANMAIASSLEMAVKYYKENGMSSLRHYYNVESGKGCYDDQPKKDDQSTKKVTAENPISDAIKHLETSRDEIIGEYEDAEAAYAAAKSRFDKISEYKERELPKIQQALGSLNKLTGRNA